MAMNLFAQITKVDAAKRLVYGRACQEVLDHSGEIFDYEGSKPYFKAWSEEVAKDTDGKSLGNLRAMHGKIAAGKLTEIDFNDTDKAIDVAAKVVDDNEWAKVCEGVYTGFSIGGSYVGEKVAHKMADGSEGKKYIAKPTELSLVDQPCVPTAKFFDIVKADGAVEKVAFKPAALEVAGTDAEVAELAKVMNEGNLTMADVVALAKAGKPKADDKAVDKGMWNVQDFASALASISFIAASAQDEADWEGDKSPIPEKLRTWLKAGADIFKAMAKEEADELVASLKGKAGKSVGITLELMKALRPAAAELTADEVAEVTKAKPADLAKALTEAGVSKASKATMQAVHDMVAELGGKCAAKAAPAGDLAKVQEQLAKALVDIDALKKQPAPHVLLRTVAVQKGALDPGANELESDLEKVTRESLTDAEKLKNADGSIDWQTSIYVKKQKVVQAHQARTVS